MTTTNAIRPCVGRIANASRNLTVHTSSSRAIPSVPSIQRCPFSSTPELNTRRVRRDGNRLRGLSSIYRSGPRFRMNIDKSEIPRPSDYKPHVETDPNHGLWQFFYKRDQNMPTPEDLEAHGRGWAVEELRQKSWDDLHKLWWVCVKEQNRIMTAKREFEEMKLHNGKDQMEERLEEVQKTMRSIKHTLTERFYVWEDARKLAEEDPEIDLNNTEVPFRPSYMEEIFEETDTHNSEALEPAKDENPRPEAQLSTEEGIEPSTMPPKSSESQQSSTRI
ncbi:MRP-L47-domain-containing protein [Xylariaceae sp. FL0016]|nr:MRP-L47-domain-containing protein [Xylariaceae sp. FL0016]